MARTVAFSPTRTAGRSGAATRISAQTLRRSEMVKTWVVSCTASPTDRCFSTITPSNGARSSKRLSPPAPPPAPAPVAASFCWALETAISASRSAWRACR